MNFFHFKSLQSRLLFVFLSLFVIVGFFAFFSINSVHERNARNQIEAELKFSASVVNTLINSRLEAHRQAASILSKDYAFQQAFSTNDQETETVSSAMESLLLRTRADLIMLLSIEDNHKIMVTIPKSKLTGNPFPYLDLISQAEDSGRSITAFINLNGELFSVIIVPILAPEPLVWFCIGFRVDNQFLQDLQKMVPSDLTLVELMPGIAPKICASTLHPSDWKEFSQYISQVSLDQGISVVNSRDEHVLVQGRCLDKKTGAWLMIQHSLEQTLQPFYRLQTLLLRIGFVGLIVTFLGAVAISRSVSKPVRELAEISREVAKGIYEQHVTTDLEDEIGELARSFNQMTDGLAERSRIRSLLGKVVSPAIAEELLKSKEFGLGGAEKEATILFSDIRDFTTLCEGRAPSEILQILNHYLTRMNEIIDDHGGVVDKFIGDAIMALFGTPIYHEDDPDRAMQTALAMIDELKTINRELEEKGFPPLKIGIGINTDVVVAGSMGSRNRLNYTVIGDGVNLASRLESECKTFQRSIIISEGTLRKARKKYRTECLGKVKVKGKQQETNIFALLGEDSPEQPNPGNLGGVLN
ncbi:MAG: HAMP domain-containing protein [Candidatus Riflebacteria bacterium]|nr:HAMP domain-containing protein [Candidatus Riflebacteria bacterium]